MERHDVFCQSHIIQNPPLLPLFQRINQRWHLHQSALRTACYPFIEVSQRAPICYQRVLRHAGSDQFLRVYTNCCCVLLLNCQLVHNIITSSLLFPPFSTYFRWTADVVGIKRIFYQQFFFYFSTGGVRITYPRGQFPLPVHVPAEVLPPP